MWRKIGDFHTAEEITQDVFLKAYQRLAKLKKPQSFVSWLYVIAANDCSTWLRKKRLSTQPLEDTSGVQLEKATYSGYIIAENERTSAEAQRDAVQKLLAKLQESDRTIITLLYFAEMTCKEISEFLGVSANTIKSRLSRARQHLKKNANLVLAEFYRDNNMSEKAEAHIQKTGFIIEDAWLTLGPFDNTYGIGYHTAYISENATQVDTTQKYAGMNGQLNWQKSADNTLNGYITLGDKVDWGAAYAFATVTSPDEREVHLKFDSDDQGKVWLNGKEVFTNTEAHSAIIDRYMVPVTLRSGENSILVKVCEEEDGWGFYLRVTDTDAKPIEDLKINYPAGN